MNISEFCFCYYRLIKILLIHTEKETDKVALIYLIMVKNGIYFTYDERDIVFIIKGDVFSKMYYIYENWRAENKAVIHKGECRFCNNGKGTAKGTLGESNGKWHGGYSSYNEARKKAESLDNREIRDCKSCIK